MGAERNLIFTIAFDRSNQPYYQMMAKMLVSSIQRSGFEGDVLILTNSPTRVFEYGRPNLEEISLDTSGITDGDFGLQAQQFKYRAREYVDAESYAKVLYVDADCLFLRNPEELLLADADLCFSEEPASLQTSPWNNSYLTDEEMQKPSRLGANSGLWWVRSEHFQATLREWERIDSLPELREKRSDQPAWNRLVLDTARTHCLRLGAEVHYPMMDQRTESEFAAAVLLHFNCAGAMRKLSHMFGNYMRHFHTSSAPALLSFLDG